MVDAVSTGAGIGARPKLDVQPNMIAVALFLGLLGRASWSPLGFEFVNGLHDTANVVAVSARSPAQGP